MVCCFGQEPNPLRIHSRFKIYVSSDSCTRHDDIDSTLNLLHDSMQNKINTNPVHKR